MQYNFKNLVFEGGGVKGIAYAGALKALKEKKILASIEKVAGTSAGAISALLVSLGFTPEELEEILRNTSFGEFKDASPFLLQNIFRMYTKFGWFKADAFQTWLTATIAKKTNPKVTFAELKKEGFRELHITGTNISKQRSVIFNHQTSPKMKVADAVRISMSIPFFFPAIEQQEKLFIDGGLYYNFPISIFDTSGYNKETLGLRVDTSEELNPSHVSQIKSIKDYIIVISGSLVDIANKIHLDDKDWHRTIYIDCGDIKSTQFNLTESQKDFLVKAGQTGVKKYFDWFDNPRPKEKPLNK